VTEVIALAIGFLFGSMFGYVMENRTHEIELNEHQHPIWGAPDGDRKYPVPTTTYRTKWNGDQHPRH